MNKDDLYIAINGVSGWNGRDIANLLNKFFESNVCIPKGNNPHPDSKLLHLYLENCAEDFHLTQFDNALDEWFVTDLTYETRFRVEPPEPIYEWQWAFPDFHNSTEISEYYTDDEVVNNAQFSSEWVKLEWTKQERT